MYPDGRQDDTHLSLAGATAVARLAAKALLATDLPLARHVRLPNDTRATTPTS